MKGNTVKKLFLLLFIITLCLPNISLAQGQIIKDKKKDQEIVKKAEELNMSVEEIEQIAKKMGITIDEYFMLMELIKQQKGKGENLIPNQLMDAEKEKTSEKKLTDEELISDPQESEVKTYIVEKFLKRTEPDTLEAFGYNTFEYAVNSFEPYLDIPVPKNYIIGPGDEIILSVWGETQLIHNLTVSKEGSIYIPDVGMIVVNGLTIEQAKSKLLRILSGTYSTLLPQDGTPPTSTLDISTGKLRTVKVYVVGEVSNPGVYSLPSQATALTAIYFCGGPLLNGSMRNIYVKRDGKIVANVDLYNYLISGDNSDDVRLQDEDVIVVPAIGNRVAVVGQVNRPAIYELKQGETLGELITYAGDLQYDAYINKIFIERFVPFSQRDIYKNDILSLDLSFNTVDEIRNSNYTIEGGDLVQIRSMNDLPENRVTIQGPVKTPGFYELKNGMTIADLIKESGDMLPSAFQERGIVVRTLPNLLREVYSFNINKALENDPQHNLTLKNRDIVYLYQHNSFFPERSIEISGSVKNPGLYVFMENMRLSDLIVMAGGLTDTATVKNIEISRLNYDDENTYSSKIIADLDNNYWETPSNRDPQLKEYDRVLIKADPMINFPKTVFISGEVKYPGSYTLLKRNERVSSLIERAGGLLETAYEEGIYVIRENPYHMNQDQDIPDSLKTSEFYKEAAYQQLIEPFLGRMAINWNAIEEDEESNYNIPLEAGDSLVVSVDPKTVFVSGEVEIPSVIPYKKGANLAYYIKQAGGYTENANAGEDIVILPNGTKWEPSGWFFIADNEISSGTVIIVPPLYKEESDFWPIVRDVVSVVSSAAVLILTIEQISK